MLMMATAVRHHDSLPELARTRPASVTGSRGSSLIKISPSHRPGTARPATARRSTSGSRRSSNSSLNASLNGSTSSLFSSEDDTDVAPLQAKLRRVSSAPSTVPRPFFLSLQDTTPDLSASYNLQRPRTAVRRSSDGSSTKLRRASSASIAGRLSQNRMSMPSLTEVQQLHISSAMLKMKLEEKNPEVLERARASTEEQFAVGAAKQSNASRIKRNMQIFDEWAAKDKAKLHRERRAKLQQSKEFELWVDEVVKNKTEKSESAFLAWLDKKDSEMLEKMNVRTNAKAKAKLQQPFTIKELEGALAKIIDEDDEFSTLSYFFREMLQAYGRNGKLSKKILEVWIFKVALDCKIDDVLAAKRDAAEAVKIAKKDSKPSAGAKVMKVILDGMKLKSNNFGDLVNLLRSRFDAASGGDGSISREKVKGLLESFEVALNPAQSNDLLKYLDSNGTGSITYEGLENSLVEAETAPMDPYSERRIPDIIVKIKKIMASIDYAAFDLLDLVSDVAEQIIADRKNSMMSKNQSGITYMDFRIAIRNLKLDLPPAKRIQLASLLDRAFYFLDTKKSRCVARSELQLFLRQLVVRVQDTVKKKEEMKMTSANHNSGLTPNEEKLLLRIGKVFLMNMQRSKLFGNVVNTARDMFRAIDQDNSGSITKTELRTALVRMNCGLSPTQEMELITFIDRNGDGMIDLSELESFLTAAQNAIEASKALEKDRENPEFVLMDEFMTTVTTDAIFLKAVFKDLMSLCLKMQESRTDTVKAI